MTIYEQVWARYGRDGSAAKFLAVLKTRMRQFGLTQADLSRESGCSPTHVSRWLAGKVVPSLENKLILDEAVDRVERRALKARERA